MKTAGQIAAEVADKFARHAHALDWEDGPKRRAYIIHAAQTAIEADRAQRKVTFIQVDTLLAAYDAYEGDDEAGFIQEWTNRLNGEDA